MKKHKQTSDHLFKNWKKRIEHTLLEKLLNENISPKRLHEAVKYSTLNGGKRIRGLLVYATGYLLGAKEEMLDIPACAIESIQSFSLIHDDLPALDNDDLRRGMPSCHKAFDEATAILAGDALQMFAFEQLANAPNPTEQKLEMIRILAKDCGSLGMIGGGSLELEISGSKQSIEQLEQLHWLKCGKLIRASIMLGAYGSTVPDSNILSKLETYAYGLGVGYQISNDLLDCYGDLDYLGKQPKSDQAVGRTTFSTKFDHHEAKVRMTELFNESIKAIEQLNRSEPLVDIVQQVKNRTLAVLSA